MILLRKDIYIYIYIYIYNAQIKNIKDKIPDITNLATTTALAAVENKIPNVSNLVKKDTDHNHDKYITTQEFNSLRGENFAARLAQANLASKNIIVNFVKNTDFHDKLKSLNKKITSNKTKHVFVENEFKNDRHLTRVFLLVKATFLVTEHNLT